MFRNDSRDLKDTINLVNKGSEVNKKFIDKNFQYLSKGFAGGDVGNLDERLAWLMSFRTVYNAPLPTLWLGSVVTMTGDDGELHLLCMRPRCDCVRLKEETKFFFLQLVDPGKKPKIIIRVDEEFKRLGIALDSTDWIFRKFKPSEGSGAVIAKRKSDRGFKFTDIEDNHYTWQGELKSEYAQRIAQAIGTKLTRVAVDESEWFRRMT